MIHIFSSDARHALLAANLERHATEAGCNVFSACLKYMLQYYNRSSRIILAPYLTSLSGVAEETEPAFITELPESWRLLGRVLELLETQISVVRRFSLSMGELHCDIKSELNELSILADDVRRSVSHKRGRLDHQLNEALLKESRANLQVANLTVKESQGTKLRKLSRKSTQKEWELTHD